MFEIVSVMIMLFLGKGGGGRGGGVTFFLDIIQFLVRSSTISMLFK